jgi:hypothetical protein
MIVACLFFVLSDALRVPFRRRRALIRRRHNWDVGGFRGIKFLPREVKQDTPFTMTFWAQWKLPFNVTLGGAAPIHGRLDEFGNPQIDVPGLPAGQKKIIVQLSDGPDKVIGFISVKGGFQWALTLTFSAVALLVVGLYAYRWAKSEEPQKRKKESDGGFCGEDSSQRG